jgi:1-acyl-sn-glycerol-3-phosphate acyltransferase
MDFEYKNYTELKKLTLQQLEEYQKRLRKYQFESSDKIKYIKAKKAANLLIKRLIIIDRLIAKRKLIKVGDASNKTSKPVIYVVTHVGRYDIESAIECTKRDSYLFMGDPGETYLNFDGFMLSARGVIYLDTSDKEDRKLAKETGKLILKHGGNVMIFPEGAWNIKENELVQKLFPGSVDMARETGAEIVPVAIEKRDNDYYYNIGKNIKIAKDDIRSNRELSDDLRDTLATLKWDILTNLPIAIRTEMPENASELFLDSIMSQTENGYTVEEIKRTRYRENDELSPDKVFTHLKK